MENIRLLSNQVLLKLIEPDKSIGRIILPETVRADKQRNDLYRGTVIATGPGTRGKKGQVIPCDVQPGDVVSFYWLAGNAGVTKWPDDEHRVIREDYIQAVYYPEPAC